MLRAEVSEFRHGWLAMGEILPQGEENAKPLNRFSGSQRDLRESAMQSSELSALRTKLSETLSGYDARDSGQIVCEANIRPAELRGENSADVICGVVAELDDENPARAQERCRLLN